MCLVFASWRLLLDESEGRLEEAADDGQFFVLACYGVDDSNESENGAAQEYDGTNEVACATDDLTKDAENECSESLPEVSNHSFGAFFAFNYEEGNEPQITEIAQHFHQSVVVASVACCFFCHFV